VITYLLAAWWAFWAGRRWRDADCGCSFTVHGPFQLYTCYGHTWCRDEIAELVSQVKP